MDEKSMVNDILSNINCSLNNYNLSIQHCSNENLRNYFISLRNKHEVFVWDLYSIAKQKGYYIPAAQAGRNDIDQVKQSLAK